MFQTTHPFFLNVVYVRVGFHTEAVISHQLMNIFRANSLQDAIFCKPEVIQVCSDTEKSHNQKIKKPCKEFIKLYCKY